MPFLEHEYLTLHDVDGSDEHLVFCEAYSLDVALFLIFDPTQGFLFERRVRSEDPLFGKIIIPAGKIRDLGERRFPLWGATRECYEESGTIWSTTISLTPEFDIQRRIMLYPTLMTGDCWGSVENREPEKKAWVWKRPNEVYQEHSGRVTINPSIEIPTTRQVLVEARQKMTQYGISCKVGH